MSSGKPILVTGSHRSSSTWVGKTIARSPRVIYLREPFSPLHSLGICGAKFDRWFTYICQGNQTDYYPYLQKTINLSYNFSGAWQSIKNWQDVRIYAGEYRRIALAKLQKRRPLLKDPIAIFSSAWLANTFDMDVIVISRHPAAFAASLKKANWRFSFANLLEQPLLIQDYLEPFLSEIEEQTEKIFSVIDQSILIWRIIHYVIWDYQQKYKNWLFVRHEDLSREPVDGFKAIFQRLNLVYTKEIENQIIKYSNAEIVPDDKIAINEIRRNSKMNITSWKNRLTAAEIETIREKTQDIADKFYSERDW